MFAKNKTNPVYELEKQLINDKLIICKVDNNGVFETTEKIMYDAIEKIYNKVLSEKGKSKKLWYIVWGSIGFLIGLLAGIFIILSLVKK